METEIIINKLEQSSGNYCRNQNEIYISLNNMLTLPNLVKESGELHSMLITPYLIGTDNNIIFELHYYLVDYPEGNLLTKEIVDNFKPKAFVALNDITFYERVLNDYLKNIQRALFKEERKSDSRLEKSMLYFQVF